MYEKKGAGFRFLYFAMRYDRMKVVLCEGRLYDMTDKVLVLGGSYFVGRKMVEFLAERGYEMIAALSV